MPVSVSAQERSRIVRGPAATSGEETGSIVGTAVNRLWVAAFSAGWLSSCIAEPKVELRVQVRSHVATVRRWGDDRHPPNDPRAGWQRSHGGALNAARAEGATRALLKRDGRRRQAASANPTGLQTPDVRPPDDPVAGHRGLRSRAARGPQPRPASVFRLCTASGGTAIR
jgi:hypothetical protein